MYIFFFNNSKLCPRQNLQFSSLITSCPRVRGLGNVLKRATRGRGKVHRAHNLCSVTLLYTYVIQSDDLNSKSIVQQIFERVRKLSEKNCFLFCRRKPFAHFIHWGPCKNQKKKTLEMILVQERKSREKIFLKKFSGEKTGKQFSRKYLS